MASRRDELNAYTFAKRRTVAAFLRPSATGTEEDAPRPLRTVLPGLVAGALLVSGAGVWGLFSPQAPKGWDTPGAMVIVGKRSTTRYVVLSTDVDGTARTRLHPVLNLASARLLLDPRHSTEVSRIDDGLLDAGKPPRGPVIGIPYAPDRLPAERDAAKAKRWAVCQRSGGDGRGVRTAAFVLADREAGLLDGAHRTTGGQVLYVRSTGGAGERYLVDPAGTKYRLPDGRPDSGTLTTALVGTGATPQPVTEEWLATLAPGDDLGFPQLPGTVGATAGAPGLGADGNRVGMVLSARTGSGTQHYVVLPDRVAGVSEFVARLLIAAPATGPLGMRGRAREVDVQALRTGPGVPAFKDDVRWPRTQGTPVNSVGTGPGSAPAGERRDTVCSVLRSVDDRGEPTLSTWAGPGFPVDITAGGTGAYVTPGTGLLYTQVRGRPDGAGGALFLVTDTGLRYAVPADGGAGRPGAGVPGPQAPGGSGDGRYEPGQAQVRLGYGGIVPVPVPAAWSEFLSKGPRLDTDSARQPQGS
ncbi:type VII secretion protein EccB [Streptomyces polychromogenes]|uniref:Type VII secretion protein EccB n=1 Tax=Streptomyces polychromogenes TaxID=67342 RepID=A0ABP3FWL8_9ACTN